ncbi:hypothetical protein [Bifidobacterium sp. ESL0790]|uniref:hypothetical protein n=1 Tax=Bifidobacterium sp. ESL0790 TaxID=2983233 RepID=UPI0023F85CD3|nr:hypothetical protein [Bifidobacterium sp. ESL0790]WEV72536.1 hypothetical protein OZY47_00665 [Bifidobacterium sp. ESL0790]
MVKGRGFLGAADRRSRTVTGRRVRALVRTVLVIALAVVCLLASNVIPPMQNGLTGQTMASAANDPSCATTNAAGRPIDWRTTECATNPDGAVRKPALYRMLATNNKIDTLRDELRMDFVMRVAHGEINPNAGTDAAAIGMKIRYDYGDGGVGSDGTVYPNYNHPVNYMNTYVDSTTDSGKAIDNANRWAQNQDENFTIPKIMHAGLYDYVTVSIQADMNISDEPNGYWTAQDTKGAAYRNGRSWIQHVWVEVGPPATNPYNNSITNAVNSQYLSWQGQSALKVNDILSKSPLVGDMADSETVTAYPGSCYNIDARHGCDVPAAWVGFDSWPETWSYRQANWGMMTDKGIGGVGSSMGGWQHDPALMAPGVAPPNSFFVSWYNPALGLNANNPCYQVTGFKYQWIGLQDNKWVPVDALTPKAQTVSNMPAVGAYPNSSAFTTAMWKGNTLDWVNTYEKIDSVTAFNSVADYNGNPTPGKLIVQDAGNGKVAQSADGSINFKQAKDQQGLDGYFKLVTWPIVNQQCTVSDPVRNPAPSTEGIDDQMAATDQAAVQQQIDKGWTLDTAFYDFDIARPDAPTIDKFNGYSDPAHRTVTGEGTPGYLVTVYAEDPAKPIDPADPDNLNTKGREIGTVEADPTTGKWTIEDPKSIDISSQYSVRYHAWQSDKSPIHVTSIFSNIATARFQLSMNSNPEIQQVYAPHSVMAKSGPNAGKTSLEVDGKTPKVKIRGTIHSANHADDKFSLYAVPQTQLASATTPDVDPGEADDPSVAPNGLRVPDEKYKIGDLASDCKTSDVTQIAGTGTNPNTNPARWKENWSCTIDPSRFPTEANPKGSVIYSIYAVLQDTQGGKPAIGRAVNQVIDMVPPIVKVTSVTRFGGVQGTVEVPESPTSPEIPSVSGFAGGGGEKVTVTWPNGTQSTTTTKANSNGAWRIDIPAAMPTGDLKVTANDRAAVLELKYNINSLDEDLPLGNGNESDLVSARLTEPIPANELPFTGAGRWWIVAAMIVAAVVVLSVAGYVWLRGIKEKAGARHARH